MIQFWNQYFWVFDKSATSSIQVESADGEFKMATDFRKISTNSYGFSPKAGTISSIPVNFRSMFPAQNMFWIRLLKTLTLHERVALVLDFCSIWCHSLSNQHILAILDSKIWQKFWECQNLSTGWLTLFPLDNKNILQWEKAAWKFWVVLNLNLSITPI